MTPPISSGASGPAPRASPNPESCKNGATALRKGGLAAVLVSAAMLSGCASNFIPPDIAYDAAVPAKRSAIRRSLDPSTI
jgi:hypothetical protein